MCVISLGCLDVWMSGCFDLSGGALKAISPGDVFKKRVCVFLVRINGCLDVLNIVAGTK